MISDQDFDELVEFHHTDGPFRGFDCLGYIGNRDRNYLTDEWVIDGANALGWDLAELGEWVTSWWGRKALEGQPRTCGEMRALMAQADIAALMEEILSA